MAFAAKAMHQLRSHYGALVVVGALAAGAGICGVSLCPFAALTGLPCPGCGLLRACLAFIHGRFTEGLRLHPLAPGVVPTALCAAWCLRSGRPMRRGAEVRLAASMALLVIAMFAIWMARFRGALGGPVAVDSIWSASGTDSPLASALGAARSARHREAPAIVTRAR